MPLGILILEPDPMQQVGFRAALSSAGFAAVTVASVSAAIEHVRERSFGLILIGPGQTAAEMAHDLRAAADPAPPVVALDRLPDCMVGHAVPGNIATLPKELPALLEALTRYMRFAPPRPVGGRADQETLLQDWAEFEDSRPS